jgi:hypothetical protein
MNVETGTVATVFLFWECLFQIFGIGALQCSNGTTCLLLLIGIALMYVHYSLADVFTNALTMQNKEKKMIIREGSEDSLPFVNDAHLYVCTYVGSHTLYC